VEAYDLRAAWAHCNPDAGEKAVMFRQMAKHARLMTTSRYIERTAPHRKSWVDTLKP
jgi:hypothetical protein